MVGGSVAFGGLATAAHDSTVEGNDGTLTNEDPGSEQNTTSESESTGTVQSDIVVAADPAVGDFDSIQSAIDDATDGDTIEVRPGTYTEAVVIRKNISLIAPDGATVENESIDYPAGIQVLGPATPTISGFTITGWRSGFSAGGSEGAWTLRDTMITDSEFGVGAAGTPASWTVANVTVTDTPTGLVAFESTGDWSVRESTFRRTGGISADDSTGDWTISRTTVRNGTDEEAINAEDSTGQWTVANATFVDNEDGIRAVGATDDWTVRDSTIDGATNNGVSAEETDGDWTLDSVTISETGGAAVDATRAEGQWTIKQSRLRNVSGAGVVADEATEGNATHNYWGASDGPSGNFNGSGAAAFENVVISPFYTDAELTTLSEEPPAREVTIEHDPSSGSTSGIGGDPKLVAEKLNIVPGGSESSIAVGGDSSVAFEIAKPSTGQTVTVEPEAGEPTVSAESIGFGIYSGDGTIGDSATILADSTRINVSVSGDTGMFADGVANDRTETSDPFAEYEVRLLRDGDVVDSTEPRLIGIGYNIGDGIKQNATAGEIEFSIPRENLNEGIDSEWVAAFSLGNDIEFAPVEVENEAGDETFNFTVDVSDVPPGEYTYRLELYDHDGLPGGGELDDRVINVFGVDEVVVESENVVDPPVSIEHNPGSSTISTPTGDGSVYADQLDIFVDTDDPVTFGGEGDLRLRVVDPDTGDAVTYTPTNDARTVPLDEIYRLGFQNDGTGEPQAQILPFPDSDSALNSDNIDVTVEGDTGIYTDGTFNEYVVELVDEEGDVIDSTDERLVGMGYEATFEQNGDIATITRDPAVGENWTVEFRVVGDNRTIPPSEQIIDQVEIDHADSDGEFEIPLNELDVDPGEYRWDLVIVDEQRAELDRERIISLSGSPQTGNGVRIREPIANEQLEITNINADGTVSAGEIIEINTTVRNTGEIETTQDVTFTVNDTLVETRDTITLGAGETQQLTFTAPTNEVDAGKTLPFTVETTDDDGSGSIEVLNESEFTVSLDSNATETTLTEETNLSVVVEVENVGGVSDSQTIAVDLLNQTEDGTRTPVSGPRESVELDPGENTTIETTVETDGLAPGAYTITTYSEDVEDNLGVTIRDEPELELAITEFNDSVVAGDTVSVTANVTDIDDTTHGEQLEFVVDGEIVETRTIEPSTTKSDYDVSGQRGIALAEDSIYVTENGDIVEIDRETGDIVSQFAAPDGTPRGLTYADGSLWFTDTTDANFEGGIVELDPETGAVRSQITNDRYDPSDLAYEDGSLWVLEVTSNSVRELDPDTGEQLSQFDVGASLDTTSPRGLSYQNETLWVGTSDTNELGQFTTDGRLIQRTGKRVTGYRSLASDGRALYGPDTDGHLTVLRQFDDSDPVSREQPTERFVYQTNESDVPEITAAVTSESANDSVTVSVNEPAGSDPTDQLVVDSIQGPSTITQTQRPSVSATVTNPTSNNTTESVAFGFDVDQDGTLETISTRELTLAPGANTTVGFTAPTSFDPGEYSYGIIAADETQRQVTVVGEEFETAVSTGDPHLVTFDGVAYDYMAAGEYTLVREPAGSLEIQARQEPIDRSNSVTINTALATTVGGESVVIDVTDSTPVQINGTPTEISDGEAVAVGNGTIERTGSSYAIVYPGEDDDPGPTDERVVVDVFDNRIDIEVRLDADRNRPVEGILGNIDDNSSNDIALANGTVVSNPSNSNELYGSFRDDWRVTENTTLFEYEGDNGPETYYDPTIPRGSFTVNDIDPDTRTEAEQLAAEAGLTPGTSAYRNALIDYALTGDESYFSSAQQQNASTDINETVTPDRPPELNGSNTLSVTATNASGDIVPGAEIKLYNDSFVILNSRQANQSGIGSWSTLTAGEYNVELYGPEGSFWGSTSVTVDNGASTTVQRTAPRLSQVTLEGDENGDGGFYGGQPVTISPEVRNDGPERPVRVQIHVDTNNDNSAEKNVFRGGLGTNISSDETGFYGYEYDPSTNGTKQVRVVTEAYLNNEWTKTDDSKLSESLKVEHNIVGYDPQNQTYNNITTSINTRTNPSASASLPNDVRISNVSLPGMDYTGGKRVINSTRKYPWSPVGELVLWNNRGNSPGYREQGHCTATIIDENHIITAAHCVYGSDYSRDSLISSGQRIWATEATKPVIEDTDEIRFVPGSNKSNNIAPNARVTYIQTYKKWTNKKKRTHDLAVLTIDDPNGDINETVIDNLNGNVNSTLASETGTFGYESYSEDSPVYGAENSLFTDSSVDDVHATGYPKKGPYVARDKAGYPESEQWDIIGDGQGTSPWTYGDCRSNNMCHQLATSGPLDESLYGGQSGGPVWKDSEGINAKPEIISILSAAPFIRGPADAIKDNIAIRINDKKYSDIGEMINNGYEQIPQENPVLDLPTQPDGDESGSATGDPHLTTYDGVAYDFQAAGEFILTNDSDGSPHVQARLRPVADRDVSVISAVATELNGTTVTIDARDEQMLTVDGIARSLETGESLAVGDGEIFRTPETYIVVYPGADGDVDDGDSRLEATVAGDRLDVVVKPNRTAVDSMTGLLGSPDGNPDNDLMLADGTTLSTSPSFETLYGQYREDYRVTAENSLFDYDAGESAAGFYDPNYPSDPVTVDDLPADDREVAIEAATNAGLEPGTAQFRDAVLDYALTEDPSYLASASMAADETEVTTDTTSAETTLTAPELTVEAGQVTSEAQPLDVTVGADHSAPDDVRVVIANGTQTVLEKNVTGAFESEETISWDTTVDGEPVADGVYTLGVIATSETGVRNTSTRGLLVDNTPPSVTVETNDTDLNATVDNTTVAFSYNDTAAGVDPDSVSVLEDGTTVTESARVNESTVRYELTDLEPGDNRTIEVRVADAAGIETNQTVSVTVATDDDSSESDADGGGGSGTTGGGGGGGTTGGVGDTTDGQDGDLETPDGPSISTTKRATISDTEPTTAGTTVNVSVGPLEWVRFGATEIDGSLTVGVYNSTPARGPQLAADQPFITGVDIGTPERVANRSATLQLELTETQLKTVSANVSTNDLVVLHASSGDETYEPIETETTRENGRVVLTAETDSFSRFIVTVDDDAGEDVEEQSSDAEESSTTDETDTGEPSTTDETGTGESSTTDDSTATAEGDTPGDESTEFPLSRVGLIMVAFVLTLAAVFVGRQIKKR
ncbi:hypothetical protein GCM10008992_09720 [Halorubrum aquaticum]